MDAWLRSAVARAHRASCALRSIISRHEWLTSVHADKIGCIRQCGEDVVALKIREVCEDFFDAHAAGQPSQYGLDRVPETTDAGLTMTDCGVAGDTVAHRVHLTTACSLVAQLHLTGLSRTALTLSGLPSRVCIKSNNFLDTALN